MTCMYLEGDLGGYLGRFFLWLGKIEKGESKTKGVFQSLLLWRWNILSCQQKVKNRKAKQIFCLKY